MLIQPDQSISEKTSSYIDTCIVEAKRSGQSVSRFSYCPFCNVTRKTPIFCVLQAKSGFVLWCHRCHAKKFVDRDGFATIASARSALGRLAASISEEQVSSVVTYRVHLPSDFTTELSSASKMWLRKYHVSDAEIKTYRIGFSPSLNRCILPVYNGTELIFWQGRYVGTDRTEPKYKNVSQRGVSPTFISSSLTTKSEQVLVIVEDILSAIAIERAGYTGMSLLGSHMNKTVASRVRDMHAAKVRVWLDPDKRKESVRMCKLLITLGVNVAPVLLANKDPKDYNKDEITQWLEL